MTHKWNYQPITPEQAEASQQWPRNWELARYWDNFGGAGNNERQRMPGSFSAPNYRTYTIRS